jgi:transporter family-2 protein
VTDRSTPLLVLAVTAAGGLLGLQGRINGALGIRLHSAVAAATVSFTIGTVLLLAVVLARHREASRRVAGGGIRWWWFGGGLAGAAVVGFTAAGVPEIGVALVTVCIVAGTAAGALLVDQLGLGPGGRHRATALRLAGALLAVLAVGLGAAGDRRTSVRPALFACLFVAGAATGWQQAANGQLRRVTGSTAVASLVSFAGGTVVLLAVTLVRRDVPTQWPGEWWMYLGGALGATYIALAAASVSRLGVLQLSLATVAGQLVAALVLDVTWPAPGIHLRSTTVMGAVLTLGAVALTGRRRGTPATAGSGS